MRKPFVLLFLIFFCISTYAQKDTVYFLYKGSINNNKPCTLSDISIKLDVNKNGNIFFTIPGKFHTMHKLSHFVSYDKNELFSLAKVLIKERVYYLNVLSKLDEKGFLNEFGYVGYQNSAVIFYIIPLLDVEDSNVPALEVSFFSKFLLPNE